MMKLKVIAFTLLAVISLAACSGNSDEGAPSTGNATSDVKQMVNDYSAGTLTAENASITSKQLIVTDKGGKETVYDLPQEEFFVSIAPYINGTHP